MLQTSANSGQKHRKINPNMNFASAAATLGAAIFLAGAPALASAAPVQAAPIHLDSVRIDPSYPNTGEYNSYTGLVTVAYTNENSVPATRIVFDLENAHGKLIDQFKDVGTFSRGAEIRHTFPDLQDDSNQQVAVDTVDFADGSSWSKPLATPLHSRRQATQSTASAATVFP
jgi:hypothetical protein